MKNPAQRNSASDDGVVAVGRKLPDVAIADKGILVPSIKLERGKMVLDGKEIGYRPWKSSETKGRVRTIYHLAGRIGIDSVNRAFIEALIAAKLPEKLPDSPYKTITILNLDDTFMGTHGIASGKFDDLRHRAVVTYCTGGVRCEVLTALLRRRGFAEVYQIDGGIDQAAVARHHVGEPAHAIGIRRGVIGIAEAEFAAARHIAEFVDGA